MPYRLLAAACLMMLSGCVGSTASQQDGDSAAHVGPKQKSAEDAPKNAQEKPFHIFEDNGILGAPYNGGEPHLFEPPIRLVPLRDGNSHMVLRSHLSAIHEAAAMRIEDFQQPVLRVLHRVLTRGESKGAWQGYGAWNEYAQQLGYSLKEWLPSG